MTRTGASSAVTTECTSKFAVSAIVDTLCTYTHHMYRALARQRHVYDVGLHIYIYTYFRCVSQRSRARVKSCMWASADYDAYRRVNRCIPMERQYTNIPPYIAAHSLPISYTYTAVQFVYSTLSDAHTTPQSSSAMILRIYIYIYSHYYACVVYPRDSAGTHALQAFARTRLYMPNKVEYYISVHDECTRLRVKRLSQLRFDSNSNSNRNCYRRF
jgi:hypothetical protein